MSKEKHHTFICLPKQWQVTKWYKEGDDVMAQNLIITEHTEPKGNQPPGFSKFIGHGELEIKTPMGQAQVPYSIPIPKATTIEEAADMIEAADKEIAPRVEAEAKQEMLRRMQAERRRIQEVRELPQELQGGKPRILRP